MNVCMCVCVYIYIYIYICIYIYTHTLMYVVSLKITIDFMVHLNVKWPLFSKQPYIKKGSLTLKKQNKGLLPE